MLIGSIRSMSSAWFCCFGDCSFGITAHGQWPSSLRRLLSKLRCRLHDGNQVSVQGVMLASIGSILAPNRRTDVLELD